MLLLGELHLAFVGSTCAHGWIENIDPSEALEMEGVIGFMSHKDVSESNRYGCFGVEDEEIFASEKVCSLCSLKLNLNSELYSFNSTFNTAQPLLHLNSFHHQCCHQCFTL